MAMEIKLDQIGSNWIKLDQIGSSWIKLDLKNIPVHDECRLRYNMGNPMEDPQLPRSSFSKVFLQPKKLRNIKVQKSILLLYEKRLIIQ